MKFFKLASMHNQRTSQAIELPKSLKVPPENSSRSRSKPTETSPKSHETFHYLDYALQDRALRSQIMRGYEQFRVGPSVKTAQDSCCSSTT